MLTVGQEYPAWAAARPIACPHIVGAHGVMLRRFNPADAHAVVAAGNDPSITSTFPVPPNGDLASALKYMVDISARMARGTALALAIADGDDRAVGYLGVGLQNLAHGRVSVGCWVSPDARGNKYLSKALDTIADWLAHAGGVYRIDANIEPWNTASIRSVERAGFVLDAVLERWEIIGGQPRDMCLYRRLI